MTKPRVLVVEDNLAIQQLARLTLEAHAVVIIAGSVTAARKELKANPDFYLATLDGRVPHFDNEPLRADDNTLALALQIVHRHNIPAYAASGDDDLNEKLVKIGCFPTKKFTVFSEVKKVLIKKNEE